MERYHMENLCQQELIVQMPVNHGLFYRLIVNDGSGVRWLTRLECTSVYILMYLKPPKHLTSFIQRGLLSWLSFRWNFFHVHRPTHRN